MLLVISDLWGGLIGGPVEDFRGLSDYLKSTKSDLTNFVTYICVISQQSILLLWSILAVVFCQGHGLY